MQAYDNFNNHSAAQKALDETAALSGRDLYFAWFNRGTNLVALQDYAAAAQAYDTAFTIYPNIPEEQRPWRMMWYQTGPYWAYFHSGRFQDVFNLADFTLDKTSGMPTLEESLYRRGLARYALGDTRGGIDDVRRSLYYNKNFAAGVSRLQEWGALP